MGSLNQSMFVYPSTTFEVDKIIKNLKPKKCHLGEILAFIVKELSDILSPVISAIFNISISKGVFPDMLKLARVVPISKKEI